MTNFTSCVSFFVAPALDALSMCILFKKNPAVQKLGGHNREDTNVPYTKALFPVTKSVWMNILIQHLYRYSCVEMSKDWFNVEF